MGGFECMTYVEYCINVAINDYANRIQLNMIKNYLIIVLSAAMAVLPAYGQSTDPDKATSFTDVQLELKQWKDQHNLNQSKGWKWMKRWEQHYLIRSNGNGRLAHPNVFLNEAVKYTEAQQVARAKASGQVTWIPAGPDYLPSSPNSTSGHGMGRVNCIAFHPSDSKTFWIGVAQGGIWKTTDDGNNWTPLNNGLPILRISDITVDPSNPDVMYACMGDYEYVGASLKLDNRKRHTHYGLGVYKTTDGGLNWNPTGLTVLQTQLDNSLLRRLVIDPNNTQHLVAGGIEGIWRSTDGGANWTKTSNALISDIEQNPLDGSVLYAGTSYFSKLSAGSSGVMRSTDFGQTWQVLNVIPAASQAQRVDVAIAPTDTSVIYALACDFQSGFFGLYRTTNSGTTWTERSNKQNGNILGWSDGSDNGGQGTYDLALAVDPQNKDRIYAGGVNAWGSADGGASWDGMSYWVNYYGPSIHADQHQFKFNPLDSVLYVCNDGGIMRTDDPKIGSWSSATWGYQWPTVWENLSSGMQITSFYRLGLSANNDNYMIAGAQDNSTFYFDGNVWINIIGGDGMECILHPDFPEILWGSSQYGRIVGSTDGGQNINGTNSGQIPEEGEWTTPFVYDPDNDKLYAGYGNLWSTETSFYSWTKVSTIFGNLPGEVYPAAASALAQSSGDRDVFYMAKRPYHYLNVMSELWKSLDGGQSWSNITVGLPDSLYITYVAIDDDSSNLAWVSVGGQVDSVKIFKTIDGGQSWTNVSMNLPNIPVNCIVLDENSTHHTLYVGTDLGVYYTNDQMTDWKVHGIDMPNVIVGELEIHYKSNSLYAATFGRGLWKSELQTDSSVVVPGIDESGEEIKQLTLYPNPNNGAFQLDMNWNKTEEVTLEVIDVMGRQVYSERTSIPAGPSVRSLELSLKPGQYYARIGNQRTFRAVRFVVQ